MYLRHFGLTQSPFSETPSSQFFLELNNAGILFRELIHAVNQPDGFMIVLGEPGIGKSTLYRKLWKALLSHKSRYIALTLGHPPLTESSLYASIGQELDIARKPAATLRDRVLKKLEVLAGQGKHLVLLIDEAQAIPEKVLEALLFLSEQMQNKRKLVQIVLFAQPEFTEKIARPRLQRLQERITLTLQLHPVKEHDIPQYVTLRLSKCCWQGDPLFTPKAINLLAKASSGVPRVINVLAHKAMMLAYGAGESSVGETHVTTAITETASADQSSIKAGLPWFSR